MVWTELARRLAATGLTDETKAAAQAESPAGPRHAEASRWRIKLTCFGAAIALFIGGVAFTVPAQAVPSFADQTGQPCQSCHVGGLGPQLTPFGREFKLHGYTMRSKAFNIPLAAMAIASFTHTSKDQPAPPANSFGLNDNFAFDQGSIFLAGGVGSHFGGFTQVTYDGVSKDWAWDNVDLRLVNTGQIGGREMVYGLSFNNSPTVQDAWNTTPAWGYPYTDSALAPGPAESPLIDEGLAQNVVGLTAYAWIDSHIYAEAGGYVTPSAGTLRWLGSDPIEAGKIHGAAPYARLAYQGELGGGTAEVGAYLLKASIFPERDRSTGLSDHYTDVGVDASWFKTLAGNDVVTANARFTHERNNLEASCTLGIGDGSIIAPSVAECAHNSLDEARADLSYYWHDKIGATISAFDIRGSSNPALYAANRTGKPDSRGITLQLDATPFGDAAGSPVGPLANIRVGIQYTAYTRFGGAVHNYDGAGAKASDNNTLRVFTWLAF